MLKFVTFAVKTQLNVHDLNNETVAGNVMDIRIMEFLDENGKKQEAPAVSGRMLKHWHYEAMRHLIVNGSFASVRLCHGCKLGEPIRPGEAQNRILSQIAKNEAGAVAECAVCDIHGYLIAQEAKKASSGGEKETGISARRSSRAMFSWLMPVLGVEATSKQVIHTRVSQQQSMTGGEDKAQMIFSKSYASGIYAFVSALDVDRIGRVELNLGTSDKSAVNKEEAKEKGFDDELNLGASDKSAVNDNNGRKDRIKVAIEAYRYLISGQMGASLSHAIPHMRPVEILVAYSETGPLPFPVSPMYSDYISKTVGLMPKNTSLSYWGEGSPKDVTQKATIDEIFAELLEKVG